MMKKRMNKKATLALLATLTTACCAFGATLVTNASADTAQPTTGFYMVEGAQIRLTSGTTGIRFRAQLSAAEYEEDKTYGVIIMPTQYLNGITGDYIASLDTKYGFTEKDGEPRYGILRCNPRPRFPRIDSFRRRIRTRSP